MEEPDLVERITKGALTTQRPNSASEPTISIEAVHLYRRNAIDNRYTLIRVGSGSKSPLAREWQRGESTEALLDVRPEALNTGLILAGFRCIDIDVDDLRLVAALLEQARQHLPPGALIRTRDGSPRRALLYCASTGQPSKRSDQGLLVKIEVLGSGQQLVAH